MTRMKPEQIMIGKYLIFHDENGCERKGIIFRLHIFNEHPEYYECEIVLQNRGADSDYHYDAVYRYDVVYVEVEK